MVDQDDRPDVDLNAPDIVKSSCEFCGQTYYIDPVGYTVMHDLPTCPNFDAMDVLEFVIDNRKIKQAKIANTGGN